MEPLIDGVVIVVTNTRSIHGIYWSLFVLSNQINMFRFINGNVDTDMKVLKVLGIDMEPMLDLPNARNFPNTMALEGFYNSLFLSMLH